MTIKSREFDVIVLKLGLKTRNSRDLLAWFEHEGRVVTRTRRSRGSGDLPMQHSIRQQLKLSEQQLSELITCKLGRADYVDILRTKGVL